MRLVLQISVIIIFAHLFGQIAERFFKMPSVLGELIAGMVIGPYALGAIPLPFLHGEGLFIGHFLENSLPVSQELYGFATLASIVLLFFAGLETDLRIFLRFSVVGSLIGMGGVICSFVFGNLTAIFFIPEVTSFMDPAALFFGVLATATSIGITARILSQKRKMSSPEGVTILAAAVLDDVVGIILLAIVLAIAKMEASGGAVSWMTISGTAARAIGFWIVCTGVGIAVAPHFVRKIKGIGSMRTVTIFCLGVALLLAGIAEIMGLAMIVGAYIMGLALSQTDVAEDLREKLEGLHTFIVPIFFCVMGMLVDFSSLPVVLVFGLAYTVVAFLGKMIGCSVPALFCGFNQRGAIRIGFGMLPRGEVTLIIAGFGLQAGVIDKSLFGVPIMTLLVASIVAPILISASFKGGSGYKKAISTEDDQSLKQLIFPYPSPQLADFIRHEIVVAFQKEQFFVHRMAHNDQGSRQLYSIRKDKIMITFYRDEENLVFQSLPANEPVIRLIVMEGTLKLKEVLKSAGNLNDKRSMEEDILTGLFSE